MYRTLAQRARQLRIANAIRYNSERPTLDKQTQSCIANALQIPLEAFVGCEIPYRGTYVARMNRIHMVRARRGVSVGSTPGKTLAIVYPV